MHGPNVTVTLLLRTFTFGSLRNAWRNQLKGSSLEPNGGLREDRCWSLLLIYEAQAA